MVKIIFDADEDWEKRTLCSDESCIGTIGHNGRCKECGTPYDSALPTGSRVESKQLVAVDKKIAANKLDNDSDDDWNKRVLCSDEVCIGVIGSDGKCKECGKPGNK